jgi:hypothetical protein
MKPFAKAAKCAIRVEILPGRSENNLVVNSIDIYKNEHNEKQPGDNTPDHVPTQLFDVIEKRHGHFFRFSLATDPL